MRVCSILIIGTIKTKQAVGIPDGLSRLSCAACLASD